MSFDVDFDFERSPAALAINKAAEYAPALEGNLLSMYSTEKDAFFCYTAEHASNVEDVDTLRWCLKVCLDKWKDDSRLTYKKKYFAEIDIRELCDILREIDRHPDDAYHQADKLMSGEISL